MTLGWLRAHRWLPTVETCVILTVLVATSTGSVLEVLNLNPVSTMWFLLLTGALIVTAPLHEAFGELESTFARAVVERAARAGFVQVLWAILAGTALLSGTRGTVVLWFVLLVALGQFCVVLLGDLAWLPCLVVGGLSILMEHATASSPVTTALRVIPWPVGLLAVAGAWWLYSRRGPRRT